MFCSFFSFSSFTKYVTGGREHLFEIVDNNDEISDEDSDNLSTYTDSDPIHITSIKEKVDHGPESSAFKTPQQKRIGLASDPNFKLQLQQQHHQQQQQQQQHVSPSSMVGLPQNFQNLLITSPCGNQAMTVTSYVDPRFSPSGIPTQMDLSSSMDSSDQHAWFQGNRPANNRYDTFTEFQVPALPQMPNTYTTSPRSKANMYDHTRHKQGGYFVPSAATSTSQHTSPNPDDHHQQQQQQNRMSMSINGFYNLNFYITRKLDFNLFKKK